MAQNKFDFEKLRTRQLELERKMQKKRGLLQKMKMAIQFTRME